MKIQRNSTRVGGGKMNKALFAVFLLIGIEIADRLLSEQRGKQSGLQTHIAAKESVSSCVPRKS
jgi:hypothetical protein